MFYKLCQHSPFLNMRSQRGRQNHLFKWHFECGKTTLAKALQEALPDCWQHVALDQFRDGLPDKFRGLNAPTDTTGALGLNVIPDQKNGEAYTRIHFGDAGRVVLRGMRRAMRALVDEGVNIIIDDIILEPQFLADYLQAFNGCEVWFVGVRCDLEVIDAREQARPGRFPGTAFGHADICHAHGHYDVEVDTGLDDPKSCATQVIARLNAGAGTAFNTLRRN